MPKDEQPVVAVYTTIYRVGDRYEPTFEKAVALAVKDGVVLTDVEECVVEHKRVVNEAMFICMLLNHSVAIIHTQRVALKAVDSMTQHACGKVS